jgi:hypothetical protein
VVCAAKWQIGASPRGRTWHITGDREFCAPAFLGSGIMPAFQSVRDFGLSRKYRLKAVGCEKCAEHASDLTTEQQWHELAMQWHSLADQAAKMSDEVWQDELA